jgi:hypothetical protein
MVRLRIRVWEVHWLKRQLVERLRLAAWFAAGLCLVLGILMATLTPYWR